MKPEELEELEVLIAEAEASLANARIEENEIRGRLEDAERKTCDAQSELTELLSRNRTTEYAE